VFELNIDAVPKFDLKYITTDHYIIIVFLSKWLLFITSVFLRIVLLPITCIEITIMLKNYIITSHHDHCRRASPADMLCEKRSISVLRIAVDLIFAKSRDTRKNVFSVWSVRNTKQNISESFLKTFQPVTAIYVHR